MKQKWYAVRVGRQPGVYTTWDECKNQTAGFSGAVFKAFPTREEAEAFLSAEDTAIPVKESAAEEINDLAEELILSLKDEEAAAFVDGSYDADSQAGGYGVIYLEKDEKKTTLSGSFNGQEDPDLAALRNVAAELMGVRCAVEKAVSDKKKKLTIFYDYAGIGCWADGSWKTNRRITEEYAAFIKENRPLITLVFQKVPAHTGVTYNEEVDQLAKKASGIIT